MSLQNSICPVGFSCQLMCDEIIELDNKICANFHSCHALTEPRYLQPLKFYTLPIQELEAYIDVSKEEMEFEDFCEEFWLTGQASQFSIVLFENPLSSDEKKSLQQAGFYEAVPLKERKFYEKLIEFLNKE